MTWVGLGVIGMMAYTFIAPRLLSKPKVTAPPAAAPSAPMVPPMSPVVGMPNNADIPMAADDLNMNFAGVAFAENVPGLSYGFPMAGVV